MNNQIQIINDTLVKLVKAKSCTGCVFNIEGEFAEGQYCCFCSAPSDVVCDSGIFVKIEE